MGCEVGDCSCCASDAPSRPESVVETQAGNVSVVAGDLSDSNGLGVSPSGAGSNVEGKTDNEQGCSCCDSNSQIAPPSTSSQMPKDDCSCCQSDDEADEDERPCPEDSRCSNLNIEGHIDNTNTCVLEAERVHIAQTDIQATQPETDVAPESCECCIESILALGYTRLQARTRFANASCCNTGCCSPSAKIHGRRNTRLFLNRVGLVRRRRRPPTCCSEITKLPKSTPDSKDEKTETGSRATLSFSIGGMDCPACTPRVERALKTLGVQDVKVDYMSASASCTYVFGENEPRTIIRQVESKTGYTCTIDSRHADERTLRISFRDDDRPTLLDLQDKLGPEAQITQLSSTDFRFVVDKDVHGASRKIYDTCEELSNGALQVIHDVDDGQASLSIASRDLKVAGARFFSSLMLTVPVLVLAWMPGYDEQRSLRGPVSLGLSTLILVIGSSHILSSAFISLFRGRQLDANVLISLAILASYLYSVFGFAYNVATGSSRYGPFFETASLLITLINLGRLVTTVNRFQTLRLLSHTDEQSSQQPETAHCIENGEEVQLHAALVDRGDIGILRTGDLIASDGVVISGHAETDESLLTGEGLPVTKAKGSSVLAGSNVLSSSSEQGVRFLVRFTKYTQENSLSELQRLMNEAKSSRSPIQDLTDKIASHLIPIVLTVSAACFVIWSLIFHFVQGREGGEAVASGISFGIAVLALSCPCALTLCVPVVVVTAKHLARKRGLIVKSSDVLQVARNTTRVVFDKTGTLTTGRMRVIDALFEKQEGLNVDKVKKVISDLVHGVQHPVSMAISLHLLRELSEEDPMPMVELTDKAVIPGKGIQAQTTDGLSLKAGSPNFCFDSPQHPEQVKEALNKGSTVFCVCIDNTFVALFSLEDELRREASTTIQSLISSGLKVSIMSGDHQRAVDSLVERLTLSNAERRSIEAKGGCLPDEKRDYVRMESWRSTCAVEDVEASVEKNMKIDISSWRNQRTEKKDVVLFVGDGSNDSAALSQADVGVSFSSSPSLALSSADAVLLTGSSGGLGRVLSLITLSKKASRRYILGFSWAVIYNALAIIFGSGMLVKVRIEPRWAGLGEVASLVPVILVAWSLRSID